MLHNYDQKALLFGVIIFPVLEQELCKGVVREKITCRISDTWREINVGGDPPSHFR